MLNSLYSIPVFLLACLSSLQAENIDLNEALQRAWDNSPALSIAVDEVSIKQSEEYQVSLYPNPIASVTVGDPDQWVSRRSDSDKEISLQLSELIELGGKRSARQLGASYETDLAILQLEAIKLDIYNQVFKGVVEVAFAQENLMMATDRRALANEVFSSIASKVEAGKAAPLQQSRAEMVLAKSELVLEKARRYLEVKKKQLASLWGDCEADFEGVDFPLFDLKPLSEFCLLLDQQENNPDLLQWDVQIAQAEAVIALEKAAAVPDLTVTAGYEIENQGGNSWMLGVSFPLPVFDRNQGNISRAEWALCQLYEKQRAEIVRLRAELTLTYEEAHNSYLTGVAYQKRLLATAQEAFDGARAGYAQGKYDYFELLDAQSTLFEVRDEFMQTLMEYHSQKADLYRLVGDSSNSSQPEGTLCP